MAGDCSTPPINGKPNSPRQLLLSHRRTHLKDVVSEPEGVRTYSGNGGAPQGGHSAVAATPRASAAPQQECCPGLVPPGPAEEAGASPRNARNCIPGLSSCLALTSWGTAPQQGLRPKSNVSCRKSPGWQLVTVGHKGRGDDNGIAPLIFDR